MSHVAPGQLPARQIYRPNLYHHLALPRRYLRYSSTKRRLCRLLISPCSFHVPQGRTAVAVVNLPTSGEPTQLYEHTVQQREAPQAQGTNCPRHPTTTLVVAFGLFKQRSGSSQRRRCWNETSRRIASEHKFVVMSSAAASSECYV